LLSKPCTRKIVKQRGNGKKKARKRKSEGGREGARKEAGGGFAI